LNCSKRNDIIGSEKDGKGSNSSNISINSEKLKQNYESLNKLNSLSSKRRTISNASDFSTCLKNYQGKPIL
jgi:hypothetical protein